MVIEVKGEKYQEALKSAHNMWASEKTGAYGKGIKNTLDDPKCAEREGRICEQAFAQYSGLKPDFQYIKRGDKKDFEVHGKKIDVKKSYDKRNSLLITAIQHGKNVFEKKDIDIYVAVSLIKDDKEGEAQTRILGYILREDVVNYPIQYSPSRKCRHQNYVIPLGDLKPIETLRKFIEDPVTQL